LLQPDKDKEKNGFGGKDRCGAGISTSGMKDSSRNFSVFSKFIVDLFCD
jgi:hypothetical protein